MNLTRVLIVGRSSVRTDASSPVGSRAALDSGCRLSDAKQKNCEQGGVSSSDVSGSIGLFHFGINLSSRLTARVVAMSLREQPRFEA